MSTIRRFEDLEVWKKARELNQLFYKFVREGRFKPDPDLERQMKKSCGSIMDNIAEGFDRGSNKEFIQFLFIAKSSGSEYKSQLYRAVDRKFLISEEMKELYELTDEINKMIQGLVDYLSSSDIQGKKHRKSPT